MEVRRRLPAAVVGFVVFVALGAIDNHQLWNEAWFYIGLGVVLSATFVEPFFSRPQDALVNAAGGIGAFAGVERGPIESLWLAYLAACILILGCGLAATVLPEGPGAPKWLTFRISSRFGRAAVVGGSGLYLIVLTQAASGHNGFEYLAAATTVLIAAVAVDWATLLGRIARRQEMAVALAAIGPRMLLAAAGGSLSFTEGDSVEIEADGATTTGHIVSRLPHRDGLRYQIALASDWTSVCATFPGELVIRATDAEGIVGAVAEGSTDLRIDFEPFQHVEIGSPISLRVDGRTLLYQVATLRLAESSWAGANAIVPHATSHMIGWPEADGIIRGGSYLPRPHDLIYRGEDVAAPLPQGFYELGRIKGTAVQIGLRVDAGRRGHIAILGMTGMGKTAVAQRICRRLGQDNVVVALDTTGEYATRLGFPHFEDNLNESGFSVYEPAGDPPQRSAEFIEQCMRAGADEYRAEGAAPQGRVVLLEEAHSFVPEWNFALRNQQDHVARSTRMLMQARKFGLTFVIVSQRTAVVSKSALSQCENYVILKTIDQTSLEYLETVVGPEMRHAIPSLKRYEAICVGPAFNAEEPVIVTLAPP